MKFFIVNLISVIIQLNFCLSYQNTKPFIIFLNNQNLNLADEEWLTDLSDMEKSRQENLCNAVVETQFILFKGVEVTIHSVLMDRDRLIHEKQARRIEAVPVKIKPVPFKRVKRKKFFPSVQCSIIGYFSSFYVMLNKKRETYILWRRSSDYVISVATESYTYQQSSEEIREQISQSLKAIPSEGYLEADRTLPLYSLNDFNQRKLCATIINIPLLELVDIPLENEQNFMLYTVFVEKKFSYLDVSAECLKCSFQNYIPKFTTFYIAQLPNHKNRVIILGDNAADVYDISEFEVESNSSG